MGIEAKIAAIAGFILLISSVVGGAYKIAYDAGYASAKAEMQEDFIDDMAANMEAKNKQIDDAVAKAEEWRQKAIDLQKKKRPVVTKYADKIIEANPDCSNLSGFSDMWSAAGGR